MANINYEAYEPVIGIEIHIQLLTKSKAYSNDVNVYGSLPNTNVSVISLGHPGTLPKPNKKVLEHAITLGLACKSEITPYTIYARKNYFYADLPKGYQITQDKTPICTGGFITIKDANHEDKIINITRIHMEEDAGKSIHDQDPYETLVDLNWAGVPLLEIVSEPELKTSQEAYNYVTEVRKLVRHLEICDGNMEEGSLRCDVNVSVMKKGQKEFNNRIEVKNMNSIRNVQRAIDYEIKRQIEVYENGGTITQETRGFDAVEGVTLPQRRKESANDYRYFPDPDLQPVFVSKEDIAKIKATLPKLPQELYHEYVHTYKLSDYDAKVISEDKDIAKYFDTLISHTKHYKVAANWLMGNIKSYLNELVLSINDFPIAPEKIAEIIAAVDLGKISNTVASQTIFPSLIDNPAQNVLELAAKLNVLQDSNEDALAGFIDEVLLAFPEKVEEYKSGKKGLMGLFVGEVMKKSQGKADPKLTSQLLIKALE